MNRKTFLTLFIIGTILRIVWINVPPLWYDENYTLVLTRLPFAQMMHATMNDVHPPLWYIIEWAWMSLLPAAPAWLVRVPALVFSVASLYIFRQLLDVLQIPERVHVAAFTLMAVLPFQLWYAQEGRMYAMLEFLVIVAFLAMLRWKWITFFVCSVAILYTQNYGPFYLVSIWLVALLSQLQIAYWMRNVIPFDKNMIKAQLVPALISGCILVAAAVMYLPWFGVVTEQMRGINDRYWIVAKSLGSILIIVYKLFMTASVPNAFYFAAYFVTFAALIIGAWNFTTSKHPALLTVAVMALAPIVMATAVSWIYQPVLLFRAFIGISPFLYIVAAWSVANVDRKTILFPAVVLTPILVSAVVGYYMNISAMKGEGAVSSLRAALAYVESHWQEGDVIYATDDGPWINLSPYVDTPIYRMPECTDPVLGSLSVKTRQAIGMDIVELDHVPHTRAWVFAPFSPLHPNCYSLQVYTIIGLNDPVYIVDDNEWLKSAVYLVESK
jgi:uncharacterized membrane protein